jgi:RNA polymerase sigma-70 factor (ECF subfamily)
MDDRESRLAWFKSVILPHEAPLRRHLRHKGVEEADIDDLVAEALARAYQVEDRARIVYGRSYLFSIARNLVLDAVRRHKVVAFDTYADLEVLNLPDEQASVESVTIAREELQRLQKVVERMPPRPRQVLLLRRLEGLGTGEIADRLSLSVSTVEKHFTRAMVLLTEAMAEHDPVRGIRTEQSWQSVPKTR